MRAGRSNRGIRRLTAAVVAVGAAAWSPSLPAAGAAAGCGPTWRVVPSPNRTTVALLQAVAAVSRDDAWAVGSQGLRVLAMRWDGTAWSIVNARNPPANSSGLDAVDAAATDDVWAVGGFVSDGFLHTLAEHWDGTVWTLTPTPPDRRHTQNYLGGVKAFSPHDAWAVGGARPVGGGAPVEPWLLHWDGTGWEQATLPARLAGSQLLSVDGTGPGDVWAVGYQSGPTGWSPLALHWDGTAWTRVPTDPASRALELTSVRTIAPDDAWDMGEGQWRGRRFVTEAQHWDGATWTRSPTGSIRGDLPALAAVGHDDVWAVGSWRRPSPTGRFTAARHWDGTSWVHASTPSVGDDSQLNGADALPSGLVWAVGQTYQEGEFRTLVMRRCSA